MSSTGERRPAFEFHQGEDYAVIMRPDQTTDNALVLVKYPDDEDIADLKTMAAAHDLLAAAISLRNFAQRYIGEMDETELAQWNAARAAITKASA